VLHISYSPCTVGIYFNSLTMSLYHAYNFFGIIIMTGEPTQTAFKASCTPVYQLSPEKWSNHYTLLPAVVNPLPASIYKLRSIKVASMKIHIMKRKPSCATTELTLSAVSKDEWNTKEGSSKSMKNALHVLRYAKRHLLSQSGIEQWKNQARSLVLCRITLVWRHRSVS